MKMRSVVAFVIAVLSLGAASARAQVAIGTISGSTSYSSAVTGFVAYIDLRGGQFTPVVTPLAPECREHGLGQVSLLPTDEFHTQNDTLLAITANTGPAMSSYTTGTCGVPAGVIVSEGKLVNPGQTDGPVLYFASNTRATVQSNPNNLAFHVTLQDPTTPQVYDAEHRPIYASFGLRYQLVERETRPRGRREDALARPRALCEGDGREGAVPHQLGNAHGPVRWRRNR